MSTTAHALRQFRLSFAAMLQAAEAVRAAIDAEASIGIDSATDVAAIQRLVSDHYRVHLMQLVLPVRSGPVSLARHVAIALCRELTPHTVESLGRAFQRHHATVAYAHAHVGDRAATDRKFAAEFAALREQARAALAALPPA